MNLVLQGFGILFLRLLGKLECGALTDGRVDIGIKLHVSLRADGVLEVARELLLETKQMIVNGLS